MRWQPWSADVFRASAASGRPILLFISTAWSAACADMARTTFEDPHVRARIDGKFLPVRVDADARPDIAERYGLEGWPTTLLLTHDGEVLQGGTYFDAASLADLLDRTTRACRETPDEIARRAADARARRVQAPRVRPSPVDTGTLVDRIAASVSSALAPGAETGVRYLHGDALVFLLRHGSAGSIACATSVLDAAAASPLCRADGAVLRCADGGNWSRPSSEITIETQASALRSFAEAASSVDRRYCSVLRNIAQFATTSWLVSGAPVTTDAGAELAEGCLAAAAALEDRQLGLETLAWLERVALATYRPGAGVTHADLPGTPAFASDHVALIVTLLDAHELTDQLPYAMLAEELGHHLVRAFDDEDAFALRDRVHQPDDVARLAERLYPFRWNARAAGALWRLAETSGEPRFSEVASRILAWAAARWEAQGLDAASLALAILK